MDSTKFIKAVSVDSRKSNINQQPTLMHICYRLCNMIVSLFLLHPYLQEQPIGVSLYTFFKLYGQDFLYDKHAISVRLGTYIPKPYETVRIGYEGENTTDNTRIYIEDPVDLGNNVARASYRIPELKALWYEYFLYLEQEKQDYIEGSYLFSFCLLN